MNIQQIIILIAGALFFTASFFIPEKKKDEKQNKDAEEKLIREILDQEMISFREQMDEELKDSVEHGREVAERYMDRITNEKMTAISEYSDTVMEQIHKNHEEAVFLYDMLNNKHAQVKNTAAELNNTVKSVRQASNLVQIPATPVKQEKEKPDFEPIIPKQVSMTENVSAEGKMSPGKEQAAEKGKTTGKQTAGKAPRKATKSAAFAEKGNIEISFGADVAAVNSNDRILALHKEGKSNMAIARELGLGIGEVKLVIDLFEGI